MAVVFFLVAGKLFQTVPSLCNTQDLKPLVEFGSSTAPQSGYAEPSPTTSSPAPTPAPLAPSAALTRSQRAQFSSLAQQKTNQFLLLS